MHWTRFEILTLASYLLSGPLAWAAYGYIMFIGRRKMLLMYRPPHPIRVSPPPRVTILIPAKDEGERIRACIASCLAQDYADVDVIAIDDRSTDDTGAVMDAMAAEHPRLRVLHITEPPAPGWTGKNNALHQGAKVADGQWLLFVDSDVVLEPDALSVGMSVVLRKEFDLLSLLPRLETHTLWESTLIPIAAAAASTMYLVALTNNAQFGDAFANGQFLLINRRSYDAIGGHETVRDRYCEDVAIARLLKAQGFRPRVSWGTDFAAVRMYSSLGAIVRGWSRIYYAARVGSPWRVVTAISFLLQCCFTAYAALGWGLYRTLHPDPNLGRWYAVVGPAWLTLAAAHLVLMTVFVGYMYAWSGNPRRNALLFPLGGSMLLLIFLRALRMCVTKKVEWRGTAYSHTMAPQLVTADAGPPGQAA